MTHTWTAPRTCLAAALLLAGAACAARAQQPATRPAAEALDGPDRTELLPPELEEVGITEHLDGPLPLDAEFTDQDGRKVRLGDYFDGERPVILTLNYYRCPMLCGLMLNGMVDALAELDWTAGEQFQIVTVSFDPLETSQLAYLKRQNYLKQYGRPEAAGGWHFLTGRKKSIDRLLDATGFGVKLNEQTNEWSHASALIICTPDGRISRYLYGILFEPRTTRLSLVEASEGKIGTTIDRFLLFCYHYDGEGYNQLATMNIMRAGGLLSLAVVAALLVRLWRRERRPVEVTPEIP